jgi:hypothetical protein
MFVLPLGGCVIAASLRWRPSRRELLVVAAWTLASGLFFYWISTFNVARFSHDSKHILRHALEMPAPAALAYSTEKGIFLLLAHSIAQFAQEDYLYALAPAIGASAAPLFVLFGWRGLARRGADRPLARALVAMAALATFSTYNYLWHSVYIHTNLGTAVYLFGLAGTIWLAEMEQETAYLPSVFLFLAAYALHRPEGVLFALVIIVIGILPSRLPRSPVGMGLALYTLGSALYLWWLPAAPGDAKMSAERASIVAYLGIAVFSLWLIAAWTRWIALTRHLPRALLIVIALTLVAGYVHSPVELVNSAGALYRNLFEQHHQMWGFSWHVVMALALLSLAVPAVPGGCVLSYGALLSLLLVLLLGLVHPWRYGPTDSGNRIMLQVLPLCSSYPSCMATRQT